jgi:tetratricopeptide (TPR) repeat protein
VESQADGTFSLLLPNKQNGDAIVLNSVVLAGYELADKELTGRQLACSESVPMEILMVNREELQREKDAIAEKARQNVELYYEKRVAEIEAQATAGKIQQAEYQQQLDALEAKYEQFEPLLELMAEQYARTDMSRLSENDIAINTAIENGDLDEAERLIHEKGDFSQREQEIALQDARNAEVRERMEAMQHKLENAEEATRQQRNALATDYYRLYSIHLSRFNNDSAAYYLYRRADLDSTNTTYQTEAGQFAKNIMADYEKALAFLERGLRHTEEGSVQAAVITLELGETYRESGLIMDERGNKSYDHDRLDAAERWYKESLKIREKRATEFPEELAEVQNNMSLLYQIIGDYKNAQIYSQKAMKNLIQHYGEQHARVAIARNNTGLIYLAQGKLKQARTEFVKAVETGEKAGAQQKDMASYYNNLATVYYHEQNYEQSEAYFKKAYDVYVQVLGEKHPLTINANVNLQVVQETRAEQKENTKKQ